MNRWLDWDGRGYGMVGNKVRWYSFWELFFLKKIINELL